MENANVFQDMLMLVMNFVFKKDVLFYNIMTNMMKYAKIALILAKLVVLRISANLAKIKFLTINMKINVVVLIIFIKKKKNVNNVAKNVKLVLSLKNASPVKLILIEN